MSAEYYAGHTDSDILVARSKAEALLTEGNSPLERLDTLASELHTTQEGRVELLRMHRVAQFVCDPDGFAPNKNIASFMYGELAGQNLLTHLTGETNTAGSHAHEFLKYYMEDERTPERLTVAEEEEGEYLTSLEEHFTLNQIRTLHSETAAAIREELTGKSKLPEAYENHLEAIMELLDRDKTSIEHFIMGYRIVVNEFHHPSKLGDYKTIMKRTKQYKTTESIAPLLTDSSPSLRPLEELTSLVVDPGEPQLESLTELKTNLIKQHIQQITPFHGLLKISDAEATQTAIHRNAERLLNEHNHKNELFTHNDILFFKGSQAILFHGDGETEWRTFPATVQIIGTFKAIRVMEAPIQRLVLEDIVTKNTGDRPDLLAKTATTPAIQLINPMIVINGETIHQDGVVIDVPLLYKNVSFQRLAQNQPNDALES